MTSLLILSVVGVTFCCMLSKTHAQDSKAFNESHHCCLQNGVNSLCADNFCRPPTVWTVFDTNIHLLVRECAPYFSAISPCLSRGRNQSDCCYKSRHVDQTLCLHICSGETQDANLIKEGIDTAFENYVGCMTSNLRQSMVCMQQSYTLNPGPPTKPYVESVSLEGARLSWEPPLELADKVTAYVVHFRHGDQISEAVTANVTHFTTGPLSVNTNYAFSAVAVSGNRSSLHSPIVHFTTDGAKPTIEAYQSNVSTVLGSSATLVCKVKVPGTVSRPLRVVWAKTTAEVGVYTDLQSLDITTTGDHYAQSFFALPDGVKGLDRVGKYYAAVLYVKHVTRQDYGRYHCRVDSDKAAAHAQVTLHQTTSPVEQAPESPGVNFTTCCVKQRVSSQCLFVCDNSVEKPLRAVELERCKAENSKITHCMQSSAPVGESMSACCVRRRVPWACSGACGSPLALQDLSSCLAHIEPMITCKLENDLQIPSPPSSIKFQVQVQSHVTSLKWDVSPAASVYHVFYKGVAEVAWRKATTSDNKLDLKGLRQGMRYVTQILAANHFGYSVSSKAVQFQAV